MHRMRKRNGQVAFTFSIYGSCPKRPFWGSFHFRTKKRGMICFYFTDHALLLCKGVEREG
ncbi:MAG: hypothetical protein C6W57_02145 [Caldibacillus debilis]|nr:MAG: hypothetical protein C6W57_02145 [Caldibacillus debilis]